MDSEMKIKVQRHVIRFSKKDFLLETGQVGEGMPKLFPSFESANEIAISFVEDCDSIPVYVTVEI